MGGIQYIIAASVCLSFFYGAYRLVFLKSTYFRQARIYLMLSVILSVLIPFSGYRIQTGLSWPEKTGREITVTIENASQGAEKVIPVNSGLLNKLSGIDWPRLTLYLYFGITALLLVRILIMLTMMYIAYRKSLKVHLDDCTLLYNHRFSNTFSFFRWIFVHPPDSEADLNQIITHEKVHVNQYHSLDILIIELLTAVMWFNPFVWIMKGSLQLVHEYLADEGALDTGIDKSAYQALLINQVAEGRIISLSSSFNQSLIKKRIIMMTKSKIRSRSVLKLLALIPVSLVVFALMAVFNGTSLQQANAMESGTFVTKNMGSLAGINPAIPDTIVKKTIIKKINKNNPNDTIVEEKEEILTGADAEREQRIVRHRPERDDVVFHERNGDRHEVRVYVEDGDDIVTHESSSGDVRRYTFHVDDNEEIREEDFGDSVRTVKIVRHTGGGEPKVEKHVIIRHVDNKPVSNVLYVVDGKPYEGTIETLDAKTIQSVDVITGKDISKYTKENFDAVMVIKTNKGK